MNANLRAPRVPAHHIAVYESAERTAEVHVHDMSSSGLFVRSTVFDPEGTEVRLHVHTHLSHEPVSVSARVARTGDSPCRGMGLYFTEPDEAGRTVIDRYCAAFEQEHRVILVDDDTAILRMMARLLRNRGIAYIGIDLPVDSEYVIARFKPQVVLLDLMMPQVDGIDLARRLRAQDDTRNITLAFYSATSMDHLPEDVRDIPFIPKGCPLKELLAAVDSLLGRAQLPA